jgi:uncharacterized membrane protein HdeD (DUF308 family)
MDASIYIARIIGPLLIVNSIGVLVGGKAYRAMAQEFLKSRALIYLTGFITLLIGLAIVNARTTGWPVALTAIGWLFVFGGGFRMLMPDRIAQFGTEMLDKTPWLMVAAGIVQLLIGLAVTQAGHLF